jgi:hypothetical protein
MRSKVRFIGKAVLGLAAIAALGGVVMLLWNAVVPVAFGNTNPLDYVHALGLLALCRILFGGFRGHRGWHGRSQWRRLQAMTPDEREQFLNNLQANGRAGGCGRRAAA